MELFAVASESKPESAKNIPRRQCLPDKHMDLKPNSGQLAIRPASSLRPIAEQDSTTIQRPFDVVIFGASGSIGEFVVEELALVVEKFYSSDSHQNITDPHSKNDRLAAPTEGHSNGLRRLSVPRHSQTIRWAVAGRSAMKLSETLGRAELSTGIQGLSKRVPILLADLNQHKSLLDMSSKTQVLINCAGPYSHEGEAVISACIESRTNYIDLAHENVYIERVRRKYFDRASRAGVYIINGCGFQSMSAEMGVNFIKQVADGRLEEVKIVSDVNDVSTNKRHSRSMVPFGAAGSIFSWGMWSSLLLDKAQAVSSEKNKLDWASHGHNSYITRSTESLTQSTSTKDSGDPDDVTSRKLLSQRRDTQALVTDLVEVQNRSLFDWLQLIRGLKDSGRRFLMPTSCLTSEESQLIRSEMCGYQLRKPDLDSVEGWRPIRCSTFVSTGSFGQLASALFWLILFDFLVKYSPFRWLMKLFPYATSLGYVNGPNTKLSRDSVSHIKFCQTFLAYGTPGNDSGDPFEERQRHRKRKQEQLLVTRLVGPEPNHVATSTFAVQASLALILERDHLPAGGGVLTPGVAFSETNIIYQLRRRNIKFEVLKKA